MYFRLVLNLSDLISVAIYFRQVLNLKLLLLVLLAAQIAAPPEARVVKSLQEVAALQDGGDDAGPQVLTGHLHNIHYQSQKMEQKNK